MEKQKTNDNEDAIKKAWKKKGKFIKKMCRNKRQAKIWMKSRKRGRGNGKLA